MQAKRGGLMRALGKYALFGLIGIFTVLVCAHVAWKYSGDGKPKLLIDKHGIQVYSIKTSGDTLLKFTAFREVKDTTLDRAAAATLDGSLENCADWIPSCVGSQVVVPWDAKDNHYVELWTEKFPEPFVKREFLLRTQFSQPTRTGPVTVEFTADPDKLPTHDCCYRLQRMHSVWKLIPKEAGVIKVEFAQDIDVGLPYVLFNSNAAKGVYGALADLPRLYAKAKYSNVSLETIYGGHPIVEQ